MNEIESRISELTEAISIPVYLKTASVPRFSATAMIRNSFLRDLVSDLPMNSAHRKLTSELIIIKNT